MKSGHGRGARGRRPLRLRGGLDGPGLRRLHGGHGGAYSVPINATASCLTGTLFLEDTYQRLNPSHNPRQCGAVAKGSTCSQSSFAPTKAADGWCEIKSKEVLDLLHGSAFVQMKFEQEEEGSDFSFHFIKKVCNFCCICCWGGGRRCHCRLRFAFAPCVRHPPTHSISPYATQRQRQQHDDTGIYVPIFRCQSDKTTVEVRSHPSIHPSIKAPTSPSNSTHQPSLHTKKVNHGTGLVTYTSPDLQCELTCTVGSDRSCSKMLDGIVKTVGTANGATIVCDPFNKSCEVNEATLAMFLNGGVKVQLRIRYNCARPVLNIPSIRLSSVQSTPRHTYTTHAKPLPKQ